MDLKKKITNTPDIANLLSEKVSNDSGSISLEEYVTFWQQVRRDLVALSEIIKNRNKKEKEYDFPFLVKSPWDEK